MTLNFAEDSLRLNSGTVAHLILNRPKRLNAMTAAMWAALPEICDILIKDGTRVLIISGAGDKAFCSGADISEFEAVYRTTASTKAYLDNISNTLKILRNLPLPTISEVNGVCFGGGCALALACDFCIANLSTSFAVTPARLGLAYSPDDTLQLIEKIGKSRAKELLMTARTVGAQEALKIKLVDSLAKNSKESALVLANNLASLAPGALRSIKLICNGLNEPSNWPFLQEEFIGTFSSKEFDEGYTAFLEKREPDFGG
jgi:enoyl-CoA hydratase/carnithine racemase